jgi:CubicO group peptidase (beta-lactamase class C family)
MKKLNCYLLILVLIIPLRGLSQSVTDDIRVKDAFNLAEKWIESQRAYEQIPGLALTFVYKQNVIWRYAVGYSDLDKETPTSTKTIHSICSISKLFTSIALLQLRDQGLIRLDDPVSKYLSWLNIQQAFPKSPPITIRALLTHSSGLPRESDYPYWNAPQFDFPTREKLTEQLGDQKTLYPADRYYQYSNLGLTLAGEIVAEVSGQDYASYINKNIIEPLGLNNTKPEMPEDLHGTRLATGYSAITREGIRNKLPFFQANAITPAAGFSSTADDLALFAVWQLRLLDTGETEVLKANTLREMQRVHWLDSDWKTARGLGFGIYRNEDITFVGHQGSCPGYRSALMIQPKTEMAVVCMANASGVSVGKFAQGVHRIIARAIEETIDSPEAGKTTDPSFSQFSGTYTFDPWGGEAAVVPWKDGLAIAYFPSDDPPMELTKLKHIEGNKFRRVRKDGDIGEEITFMLDDEGEVVSMKQHSNFWKKIK